MTKKEILFYMDVALRAVEAIRTKGHSIRLSYTDIKGNEAVLELNYINFDEETNQWYGYKSLTSESIIYKRILRTLLKIKQSYILII